MKDLFIKEIRTEGMLNPLGLDEEKPAFSWLLEGEGVLQKSCRIVVKRAEDGSTIWDSGELETGETKGIVYAGEKLEADTLYAATLCVTDGQGRKAEAETSFRTGLRPAEDHFPGASWIGASRETMSAANRGVFRIAMRFRLKPGTKRAGLVFGADDFRLLDPNQNEYRLCGENYIRYEIDLRGEKPVLAIYRVGYAPGDRADAPLACVPLEDTEHPEAGSLLREDNFSETHTLTVEVPGNAGAAWFDGRLVDMPLEKGFFGEMRKPRPLNPRGGNDVLPYPRLNAIGFSADDEGFLVEELSVRNVREPSALIVRERPEGDLFGEPGLFADLPVEDGCFAIPPGITKARPKTQGIPMLRTSFEAKEGAEIASACLYMTARGIYTPYINGKEVEIPFLSPGLTQYDRRIAYQCMDVTSFLREGKNALGVLLAPGWWSEAQTFTVRNFHYFGDRPSLMGLLRIRYADGSVQDVATDTKNWQWSVEGPYRFGSLFDGEIFDAGRKSLLEDFSKPDFAADGWTDCEVITPVPIPEFRAMPVGFGRAWPAVNESKPVLTGGYSAPVHVTDVRCAKSVRRLGANVYLYDYGQEMAGVPRILLRAPKGSEVILRMSEIMYPELPEYGDNGGTPLYENYRDATNTDHYISSGEPAWYQPKITFHGGRYIEIEGEGAPPALEEVQFLQYSSIEEVLASFTCDNPLVNRFAENVNWSQKCNFISIPTDCPQRNERMGWAGDTHVFCHTALQGANLKAFYRRNLQALADLQTPEGQFPEIAPIGGGFGGVTYECASLVLCWELYEASGDKRILAEFWPGILKYMAYMEDKGLPGEGNRAAIGPLGDWLAPKETDLPLIWNAFYFREADLAAKIAGVLGDAENEKRFVSLREEVRAFWLDCFLDEETGTTLGFDGAPCDTQTSYCLALYYGIADDRRLAEHLVKLVREGEWTVSTGFFGTGIVLEVLTRFGYAEDAYQMMVNTKCPGWLYPVTMGATSVWERWDGCTREKGFGGHNAMNSFNHYSLGSSVSWLYERILGIRRLPGSTGYDKFLLAPIPVGFGFAKGQIMTAHGVVKAGWERAEDGVRYSFEIPAGACAILEHPDGRREEFGSGCHEVIL